MKLDISVPVNLELLGEELLQLPGMSQPDPELGILALFTISHPLGIICITFPAGVDVEGAVARHNKNKPSAASILRLVKQNKIDGLRDRLTALGLTPNDIEILIGTQHIAV